ncbi:MAG: cytidylate kinase-like family protein [Deltaproteobacteria bacterium]|nr:cytidylate kinase-like family protein [Deltaproteobacteria bacterium]
MSIIIISRGSYSHGKEVAEKVAQKLGYECISREALLRASKEFNIPEIKLARALQDAPSFFERFTFGKEKYVAYVSAALLSQVQKDNVVYHGLAGHFFLQGIPHVLKVRIIADPEDRVAEEIRRDNLSAEAARKKLRKDDEDRRKWSLQLLGVDTWDPNLYDQMINIRSMTVDNAAELIATAVKFPCFQTTPQSHQMLNDLALAARVKAALVEEFPTATVTATEGQVLVIFWGSAEGFWGSAKDTMDLTAYVRELASQATDAEVEVRYQVRVS